MSEPLDLKAIEALIASYLAYGIEGSVAASELGQMCMAAKALLAALRETREALRPFAYMEKLFDPALADSVGVNVHEAPGDDDWPEATLDDLRRAAAVLAKVGDE